MDKQISILFLFSVISVALSMGARLQSLWSIQGKEIVKRITAGLLSVEITDVALMFLCSFPRNCCMCSQILDAMCSCDIWKKMCE